MNSHDTTVAPNYRNCLLDLLGSIQSAQVALQRWDAAAFERAVAEQQMICEQFKRRAPAPGDPEARVLVSQMYAALRSYRAVVERGTSWCRTLSHVLGQPTKSQSVDLRSEL